MQLQQNRQPMWTQALTTQLVQECGGSVLLLCARLQKWADAQGMASFQLGEIPNLQSWHSALEVCRRLNSIQLPLAVRDYLSQLVVDVVVEKEQKGSEEPDDMEVKIPMGEDVQGEEEEWVVFWMRG